MTKTGLMAICYGLSPNDCVSLFQPQFVKTNASPSQTKSRNRRSKFVVRTIVQLRFCAASFLADVCEIAVLS